jgi:hypothetical protein
VWSPKFSEAVEAKARDNRVYSPRHTQAETFLLQRLLRCPACGVKLVCHRARHGQTTTRYYLCPHRDPWRAGGADRRCPERRVRADELDAFVFDQVRQLLARPELLAVGETARPDRPQLPTTSSSPPSWPDSTAGSRVHIPSGDGSPTSTKPE